MLRGGLRSGLTALDDRPWRPRDPIAWLSAWVLVPVAALHPNLKKS